MRHCLMLWHRAGHTELDTVIYAVLDTVLHAVLLLLLIPILLIVYY